MKRRALSVNRTIAGMIMAGYIALLVLLLSICFFWISATQREKANLERQRLAGQVDVISKAMDMLEKHIYDTYASNRDFLKLAGVLTETENYQSAYYLQDAMQTKQALEAAMHGYVLFYDRCPTAGFARGTTASSQRNRCARSSISCGRSSAQGAAIAAGRRWRSAEIPCWR